MSGVSASKVSSLQAAFIVCLFRFPCKQISAFVGGNQLFWQFVVTLKGLCECAKSGHSVRNKQRVIEIIGKYRHGTHVMNEKENDLEMFLFISMETITLHRRTELLYH